ncbi:trypsin, alkaline B-like [Ostrinia nubilalis]|uniref:trypsin, alkaline B-like n=1 Tax=Ostrinia nubilalis TaxID=29057 RepID=UPI00308222A4
MRCIVLLVILGTVAVSGQADLRIQGGSATSIATYPYAAALLRSPTAANFRLTCAGVIVNTRSILTAASCVAGDSTSRWRVRVGSNSSISGGRLLTINLIRVHSSYRAATRDFDIAMLRTTTSFVQTHLIRAARFASSGYTLVAPQTVTAVGWGATVSGGAPVSTIRHVRLNIINQTTCANNYRGRGITVTANMVCAGWIGGRGQCTGDTGGPLVHNGVVVGIFSRSIGCGQANLPGINTRISRFAGWITINRF